MITVKMNDRIRTKVKEVCGKDIRVSAEVISGISGVDEGDLFAFAMCAIIDLVSRGKIILQEKERV